MFGYRNNDPQIRGSSHIWVQYRVVLSGFFKFIGGALFHAFFSVRHLCGLCSLIFHQSAFMLCSCMNLEISILLLHHYEWPLNERHHGGERGLARYRDLTLSLQAGVYSVHGVLAILRPHCKLFSNVWRCRRGYLQAIIAM